MEDQQAVIHVRFAPDGSVTEIGERPPALSAQAWFNLLRTDGGPSFATRAGGRGLFRVSRTRLDALKVGAAA